MKFSADTGRFPTLDLPTAWSDRINEAERRSKVLETEFTRKMRGLRIVIDRRKTARLSACFDPGRRPNLGHGPDQLSIETLAGNYRCDGRHSRRAASYLSCPFWSFPRRKPRRGL